MTDTIVLKQGYRLDRSRLQARVFTYSGEWTSETRPDFYATNIVVCDGQITFDLVGPKVDGEDLSVPNLTLGVPVWVNIENSVAASEWRHSRRDTTRLGILHRGVPTL